LTRWTILPLGKLRPALTDMPYSPDVCGWPLALARLAGSTLVISPIEEFFWRGFLYRWMLGRHFLNVSIGRFDWIALAMVSVVFGFEHAEWLAGIVAGLVFGWVMIRTRDIWAACIAHATTNFLLGVYVLWTGSWQLW
jgi:uncharacterized protein